MKFTFKKHAIKVFMTYLIIILLFWTIVYYTSKDLFLTYILLLMGSIITFRLIYYYILIVRFRRKHSKEEIEEFEKELSNVLLKYSNCFLTEKYIFSLEKLSYITYSQIVCLDSSVALISNNSTLSPGRKTILYLENGKKYVVKTPIALFTGSYYNFAQLIKKKNPNIFIGSINDYNREKETIENVKKIKNRTRI